MTVELVAVVVLGVITVLLTWGSYRLFVRNGRLLVRIEQLEHQLQPVEFAATPPPSLPGGLPSGSGAMDFELPDTSGAFHTLSQWRGRRVLLMFVSPTCSFSRRLVAGLRDLQAEGRTDEPVPVLVSRGTLDENRRLAAEYSLNCAVLIQEATEVAYIYQVSGTPMGYLIDEGGTTVRPLIVGAENLLSCALGEGMMMAGASENEPFRDMANRVSPAQPSLPGLTVATVKPGKQAPAFRLPGLSGGELTLADYRGREVLLVFADPDCPPCQRLAPLLEKSHWSAEGGDRALLMICRGDPEAVGHYAAQHGVTFPVALQPGGKVSRQYGSLATPVGFLVDRDGMIAAPAATGVDAILTLATPTRVPSGRKEEMPTTA